MIDMNRTIGKVLHGLLPLAGVAGGLLLPSCSDSWDDHYATLNLGDGTLWETLSKNSDVSNFRAVLEACGYDNELDGSQAFTVFAPVDDDFTATMRDSVISLYRAEKAAGVKESRNKAIKEFVQNHVALYNYSVSSLTNDSIVMMNGKYNALSANAFAGSSIISSNVLTSNGILYTIASSVTYHPNIYEYLSRDASFDSVCNFIYSYSVDKFDASQSVAGEIVDGKTQYLDSVTTLTNKLLTVLDANLYNEDSAYWFLPPVNDVWNKIVPQYEQYFQYDTQVASRDSLMFYYPRLYALAGTTFSRNVNTDKFIQDSAAVFSTVASSFTARQYSWGNGFNRYYIFDNPYDSAGIFENVTDVQCSNGLVRKAELTDWHVDSTRTVLQTLLRETEYAATLDSVYSTNTSEPVYHSVASSNPFYGKVSKNMYMEIAPTSTSNINVLFDIYNVLSNVAYDVYVVTVPTRAADTLAVAKATKFRAQMFYHDANGNEKSFSVTSALETDSLNVDSVFIGTYTFPTCSFGQSEAQVKMLVQGRVGSSDVKKGYTRSLNVDCIIFKPQARVTAEEN